MAVKKKKLEDNIKENVDGAVRLLTRGAVATGELIDRGARKLGRIVRGGDEHREPGPVRPAPDPVWPPVRPPEDAPIERAAAAVERGGKRALELADRGIKRFGTFVRDPEVRHAVDRGADTVGKVIDKGAELAKRGIAKGSDVIEKEKAKRRRRS
jgi:hypothetical protein